MHRLPKPTLIIFDCDGVLVDSETITGAVLGRLLQESGLPFSLEEVHARFLGRSLHQCIEIAEEVLGRRLPADFADRYRAGRDEALRTQLQPTPGVKEMLMELQVPFCVASNGERAKMQLTLGITGLLPLFEGRMFSVTEVAHPKPAPDLFLHAAATLDAIPESCVVVEDSVLGIEAGVRAGMTVIGYVRVTPARPLMDAGATFTITDLLELPGLLQL
jgi:HAD superfamily hydrolase (TIGR01509 family)